MALEMLRVDFKPTLLVYQMLHSTSLSDQLNDHCSAATSDTVNIQNFGAAKFRHFTIFDISAAIYFRRGIEGMV